MNKLIIILLLIFITSPLVFAENIPNVPDIGGPSKVHVNAEGVRFFLKNFTHEIISVLWTMENQDTLECDYVYNASFQAFFDMPSDPCYLIVDAYVTYYDENNHEAERLFAMSVEVARARLTPVSRKGCDGNTYNGSDANVPIHFNINHDGSNNHPDYEHVNSLIYNDHDLLSLNMGIYPPDINFQGCTLEIETTGIPIKLWPNQKKSQAAYTNNNKFTLSGNSIYNLINNTFYVEALNIGASYIKVKINGSEIHSGNMRYDAYAVMEGYQPPKGDHIDNLKNCEWSILNDVAGTSNIMSSFAWVVDSNCSKYGVPFIVTKTHPRLPDTSGLILSNYCGVPAYYTNVDVFGDNDAIFEMDDIRSYFSPINWNLNLVQCFSGGTIIYYSGFHAAREFPGICSGAKSSWRMYMSKHPSRLVVLHRDTQLGMGNISFRLMEYPNIDDPEEE